MELDRDLATLQEVRNLVNAAKKAQDILKNFSQEQVDQICLAIAEAGERNSCMLAESAVSETGMGKYEDKCFKNYFASKVLYDYIKDMKTVGIIRKNDAEKVWEVAEPVGVIAGIIPTTNPTSTVIYKAMIALKTRNTIVFSPHPSAAACTKEAARIVHEAAIKAGAPEGCIGCITMPSLEGTQELMKHKHTAMILATGGSALVKAAYSSGKPALGVGPGNVPAFVHRSAELSKAAEHILMGKTFDNGTICASEQAIVAEECISEKLMAELVNRGGHFLTKEETEKVSRVVILPSHGVNPKVVGKPPQFIAELAGISVPSTAKCLIAPLFGVGPQWPLSYEKLSTVLGYYTVKDWHEGCERCIQLLEIGGIGHSLAIHCTDMEVITEFVLKKPIFRILINTPAALGGVGATTNLAPSFTLGCGTWGGSSVSENVTPMHLLNIKRAAWHTGVPELPRGFVKPRDSADEQVPCPSDGTGIAGINEKVIADIIAEVIKALHKK
ncbi:acetaldehyde dehydrogenase (acetylating) [Sinanaerobacter chloroacetimidivorans]|uniref:Acetaldehyde dehydrogenase (Acetylating) n=1 Tax=Sinanaerobacter chloroacetimidivorans TaxID=2818044 RepID=A0A8J7W643_9FIRM|nr:acetaldehyde dehydrogenase (acetylating) [Sinanaerobacter chloroacetimidivorans]MBR0599880.1 acetaldehyde dehydrogenase (acetylating) [Sinanaerobacter chloroacetimidivorans]